MRPDRKARRGRIFSIFDRGATQRGGMQRRPNATGLLGRDTSESDEHTLSVKADASSLLDRDLPLPGFSGSPKPRSLTPASTSTRAL